VVATRPDPASTSNEISGHVTGPVVQAGTVNGGIHFHLSRRRRREQEEQAWANARLVLVRGTGDRPVGQDEHGFQRELLIYFINHSGRPILDVRAEAWPSGTDITEPPMWAVQSEIVQHGEPAEPNEYFMMRVTAPEPRIGLRAWRVRWTDVDGRKWCGDQIQQYQPLPYTGQPPRQYTGQPDRVAHVPVRRKMFSIRRTKS
jgi:hypothetical protein